MLYSSIQIADQIAIFIYIQLFLFRAANIPFTIIIEYPLMARPPFSMSSG